ncbi:flagellar motor switch phosphatase FliY [Rummeliibacillus sp. TYF005]|uniref:flagellar motor switch phosphatase FliY n=1 Tax=unclassified Rummeliibacillus TaxID=2622809 RepID=UPI000E67410A|nr:MULTISPECIES: flagellar motor switch phosphatase FliY [unclassified Rummeliibacillus]RIJ69255.1 flagellar motor switch phosphatase FliY [Rummeliibacillus sp. POC4]RPJ96988.1 flagellar motor switch phosphatase FliY [Rummeliibacillus sp. TYF005]
MSDDMLSQEEIEALLRGESIDTDDETSSQENSFNVSDYLDSMSQDALGEIGNISFGSSATALSSLLGQKVEITTPTISMINRNKLEEEFPHPYVAIQVEYTTGLMGTNLLVIKQADAAIIADLMLGGDGQTPSEDLGEIHLSAVQEAMNQMMGSAATSMSTIFNKKVDISPPTIDLMNISQNEGTENIPSDELLVKVSFRLKIGNLIDSNIMQLLPLEFSKTLVHQLMNPEQEEVAVTATAVQEEPSVQQQVMPNAPQMQKPVQAEQVSTQPVYEQPVVNMQQRAPQQPVNVQQAQFTSFENTSLKQSEARNLDMLLDIPLQVTVELGRTKRSVKEILELASGSIIELDKLAGEPVDILVNSRLIAKGEVVVIDENFGVRITDILSKADRLNNLK